MKKIVLLTAMLGLSSISSFGQTAFSENFDGDTFPPTGWTTETLIADPDYSWVQVTDPNQIDGTGSAAIQWAPEQVDQDESLISPSFSLTGYTSAYLTFLVSMDYEYMVDPNPNGDLLVKVSTDGGTTWNQVWVEENEENGFGNFTPFNVTVDISTLAAGQSSVMLKFEYLANDADTVFLDDITVTSCPPVSNITLDDISETTADIVWDAGAGSYDFEWGPLDFVQGTGTLTNTTDPVFSLSDLTPGTGYSFYIRSNCGGTSVGSWQGPFNIYTNLSTTADLNYAYGFESGTFGSAAWTPADDSSWGQYGIDPTVPAQADQVHDGVGFAASPGSGAATDSWLFSRGLNLTAGTTVTVSYYVREFKVAGTGGNNNLAVWLGSAPSADQMDTIIQDVTAYDNDTYSLVTKTYPVTTTGVYYFGFEHTSPAQTEANNGYLFLDTFSVTVPLSAGDFLSGKFDVYPNPASTVVNISNTENLLVKSVNVTDLNGRTLKTAEYNGASDDIQMGVNELATGTYFMTITTDKGTAVKKIIKD